MPVDGVRVRGPVPNIIVIPPSSSSTQTLLLDPPAEEPPRYIQDSAPAATPSVEYEPEPTSVEHRQPPSDSEDESTKCTLRDEAPVPYVVDEGPTEDRLRFEVKLFWDGMYSSQTSRAGHSSSDTYRNLQLRSTVLHGRAVPSKLVHLMVDRDGIMYKTDSGIIIMDSEDHTRGIVYRFHLGRFAAQDVVRGFRPTLRARNDFIFLCLVVPGIETKDAVTGCVELYLPESLPRNPDYPEFLAVELDVRTNADNHNVIVARSEPVKWRPWSRADTQSSSTGTTAQS